MLTTVLIILLILVLVGAFPAWPYNRGPSWYGPNSIIWVILLVILILVLLSPRGTL